MADSTQPARSHYELDQRDHDDLRSHVDARGLGGAADLIGVSRQSIATILAGIETRRTVILAIRGRLQELRDQGAP